MPVSVVIPVHNLWDFTVPCLESLHKTMLPASLEVIVVDNGSTDETVANLQTVGQKLFGSTFHSIRQPENLGFARACNLGAQAASNELIFFLNNDTIATSGWLPPLLSTFEQPGTGAVAPLLLYPDGSCQHCGVYFDPFLRMAHLYEHFPGSHPLLRKSRPLQAITGAAMMIPKNLFLAEEGFCTDYINGFEDIDLCFRLTKKGYALKIAPDSVFYHHTSKTPGRFKHDTANGKLLMSRWGTYIKPDMHSLGEKDGYITRIGPDLSTWLEIPPEKNHVLLLELLKKEISSATLLDFLKREPLWGQGWTLLIDTLIKEGKFQEAIARIDKAANFISDYSFREHANVIGSQILPGSEPLFNLDPIVSDQMAKNIAIVKNTMELARKSGDEALISILKTWLKTCNA